MEGKFSLVLDSILGKKKSLNVNVDRQHMHTYVWMTAQSWTSEF